MVNLGLGLFQEDMLFAIYRYLNMEGCSKITAILALVGYLLEEHTAIGAVVSAELAVIFKIVVDISGGVLILSAGALAYVVVVVVTSTHGEEVYVLIVVIVVTVFGVFVSRIESAVTATLLYNVSVLASRTEKGTLEKVIVLLISVLLFLIFKHGRAVDSYRIRLVTYNAATFLFTVGLTLELNAAFATGLDSFVIPVAKFVTVFDVLVIEQALEFVAYIAMFSAGAGKFVNISAAARGACVGIKNITGCLCMPEDLIYIFECAAYAAYLTVIYAFFAGLGVGEESCEGYSVIVRVRTILIFG
jgi:hypothetical protein